MLIRIYYLGQDTLIQCRKIEITEDGLFIHQTVLDDRILIHMTNKEANSTLNKLFKGESVDLRKYKIEKKW